MPWSRRPARVPVPMVERFAAARQAGQVRLGSFTPAELDCVALDPGALSSDVRGPALQSVSPLLPGGGPGAGGSLPDPDTLAAAAGKLESQGFLQPGVPAFQESAVPDPLAGWSAGPAGPRPVGLTGDLGIITRMRAAPYWVAEASTAPDGADWDPAAQPWPVTGRAYAAYRPPAALIEVPGGQDGNPHFALVWQERSIMAVMTWCGIDLDELTDREHAARVPPGPPGPTESAAREFTSVTCLRVTHPAGTQVLIRALVTAAGRGGRHWLLTGEHARTATPVSVHQVGEQIDALLAPLEGGGPDGSGPDGERAAQTAGPDGE
jgi:hypothetical protein